MPTARFIAVATIAAAIGFAVLPGGAIAQQKTIELKLSHFVPIKHPFHTWVTGWAEQVEKESKGRLKFTIYPSGQIAGPPNRQFDAARNGITDIAFTLHGVTPGRYPMTDLVNLPFAWPSAGSTPVITAPRLTGLAQKYLAAEHKGLRILFMSAGSPVVSFSREPVRTLEDYKGLKVRYSGIESRHLLDALGAVPMLVPPPDFAGCAGARHRRCGLVPA